MAAPRPLSAAVGCVRLSSRSDSADLVSFPPEFPASLQTPAYREQGLAHPAHTRPKPVCMGFLTREVGDAQVLVPKP